MQTAAKADRLTRSLAAPFLAVNRGLFVFIAAIIAGALVSAYWISASTRVKLLQCPIIPSATRAVDQNAARSPEPAPSSARFTSLGANRTPSEPAGLSPLPQRHPPAPACPAYFRWIHEDLRPWRATRITRETLDAAHRYGPKFRVTVIAGRLYVARYGRCFQTRTVFTQWGILQLLRRHAGRVPDLDLMFDCQDLPVVDAAEHAPPPLFRYCGSEPTMDIAFPDWSFWGWPELNIKPWDALRREIGEGNAVLHWTRRAPYAFWKGNPTVGTDWREQVRDGFRESDLAKQCTHRYKMYAEGRGWSVSEKYILACDSVALVVRPRFHDFFSRGLLPLLHYWPVRDRGQCRSIEFAVDWGNSHPDKAQEIGGNASKFMQEELTMDHVYDYMFHLLSEYAKLLRYKPTVPDGAVEVTVESMTHGRRGLEMEFMVDTMLNASGSAAPCELPLPFSSEELETLRRRKADAVRLVETWEEAVTN
ncbi:hypothetical protein QYE76_045202 [Lolium multiflorum]|uniref:Glycosyl transferase CAP10 domain-containing protein n=1 Tax=Lolium multiflorum TaxID=4521 RepID=A0AAD8TK17_LOLMU|nr:hypothetical protein QYE76_045202 [Lolium multiflorum]